MTTAILIVFFYYGYAGGSTSAEFKDMRACSAAAAFIEQQHADKGWGKDHVFAVCVPKELDAPVQKM